MESVKVMKSIYIEQTGLHYREGEECTVPKAIAVRHVETGYMEIITPKEVEKEISIKKTK